MDRILLFSSKDIILWDFAIISSDNFKFYSPLDLNFCSKSAIISLFLIIVHFN